MEEFWTPVIDSIRTRISGQNFDIWFKSIECLSFQNEILKLKVPNRNFSVWIRDNYQELILSEIHQIYGLKCQLEFIFENDNTSRDWSHPTIPVPEPTLTANDEFQSRTQFNQLNPNQTFTSFVVGSSNQLAHAAAHAVANKPSTTYNPLFIFGTVGLGKTHLLNAIGNHLLQIRPNARVIYLSGEVFTNELINSIKEQKMNEFRGKYRDLCDILLVDDIQFLAGKLRTQEEFFHTFNALHSSGRQIVLTADQFPTEIQGMEERLRNRFEWGLTADIQPPDFETRVAILIKKASFIGIQLPNEAAQFIASVSKNNIRELEGMLTRLAASSSIAQRPITQDFVEHELRKYFPNMYRRNTTVDGIIDATCRQFNLKVGDIKSHKKNKEFVVPRQIAMFLCRKHTDASYPDIGRKFGDRDHSTVIYAVRRVTDSINISDNNELHGHIKEIEKLLNVD